MVELIVKTAKPANVDFNFEEIKADLTVRIKEYQGLTYTDENISSAKTDRADLNKLSKAINDKRIETEKEYLKPFNDFKVKCDELISMIKIPCEEIDKQVKAFETKQKEDKLKEIEEIKAIQMSEYAEPMRKIFALMEIDNPKWLNATFKVRDIETEIADTLFETETNIKVISDFKSDFHAQLIDKYIQTKDLSKVMQEKQRLEQQREAINATKIEPVAPVYAPVEEKPIEIVPVANEEVKTIKFNVTATPSQFKALGAWLQANKIKYF